VPWQGALHGIVWRYFYWQAPAAAWVLLLVQATFPSLSCSA
jgi:hypothetical protein